MTIYIHGTDTVRKWFDGYRMKKNLINKWATGLSGFLCVGGFALLIFSKKRNLPRECTFTGLALGLAGLSWSALIAVIRRGYKPLPKVYFDDEILLDFAGDDVLLRIDSDTAIDKLVEILTEQEDILSDVKRTLYMRKRNMKKLIELLETGECPGSIEPTTTLYRRMFTEMSRAFNTYELDVQTAEHIDYIPDADFDTRPQHSITLLTKIEDVFLHYMYAVEGLHYGLRGHLTPEIVRENITRKRKRDAIKMMMTCTVLKRNLNGNVELVKYLQENIPVRMFEAEFCQD